MAENDSGRSASSTLGTYVAILTLAVTLVTFGIAIFTTPISGPFCQASCIGYPYSEIEAQFPRDYYWMYPAIALSILFVVLMAIIHERAESRLRVFGMLALSFATMSSTLLVADYFLQVSVIQPSVQSGEVDGIALLTQYNPHGVFIALEEIGYLLMALSMCCAAPLLGGRHWSLRLAKWSLALPLGLSILALAAISVFYGIGREYRFEVAVLTIDGLGLIAASFALSFAFRQGAGP